MPIPGNGHIVVWADAARGRARVRVAIEWQDGEETTSTPVLVLTTAEAREWAAQLANAADVAQLARKGGLEDA